MTREQFLAHWKEQLRAVLCRTDPGAAWSLEPLYNELKADIDKLLDPRQGKALELHGRIPTKKNSKAIAPDSATGRLKLWYPKEDRQRIADLVAYTALGWRDVKVGRLPALQHPALSFEFYVKGSPSSDTLRTRYRKDRDNMATTMLDVLVKAGVLVDDDIAHCNGLMQILPAVVGPTEGVRIWIK